MSVFCDHSSLSDGVHYMICELNEQYQAENLKCGWINEISLEDYFNYLEKFNPVVKSEDSSIDYIKSVKSILPVCHAIHKHQMQITADQFDATFGMDLEWTNCRQDILECLRMLKSNENSENILSFLLVFLILEHSLGDVFLSVNDSMQCPKNLKELLLSKEIQNLIGINIAMTIYIIAGPPQGVNLRNVLWHGFISGNEIPPQYGSFLIFLMAFMGRVKLSSFHINRRPMITFSKHDILQNVYPIIELSDVNAICEVFSNSKFISSRTLPIWIRGIHYYQQQRYGYALVLLVPQMEHALRGVFALANGCPTRVLTAESATLYTTFDEMLASLLPNGSKNQLKNKIGEKSLEMLLDIFVHSEGPRIRDHLSHGEVDLDMVPKGLCSHLICINLALAMHFCQHCGDTKITDANGLNSLFSNEIFLQQVLAIANDYQSVYHPCQILKREICLSSKVLDNLNIVGAPDDIQLGCGASSISEGCEVIQKAIDVVCSKNMIFTDMKSLTAEFIVEIHRLCDGLCLQTLFRPRKVLEVVSLFRSVVQHCSSSAMQIIKMANQRHQQYQNKELRSRQRSNYKRLLSLLPLYHYTLKLTLLMVVKELPGLQENPFQHNYIKFVKRVLQFTENLDSLSSPSKNRWDECKVVCHQLLDIFKSQPFFCTKEQLVELCEVERHNRKDDAWIIINDNVYDITSYVTSHPGGDAILKNIGSDATEGFNSQDAHGVVKSHIKNLLKKCYVGKIV